MKIHVGSKNKVKIGAVEEILDDYPHLKDAQVEGFEVESGVDDQPKDLESTVQGAINRAQAVFAGATYAIGLESGLMHVPGTKSGVMDVCVCVIYDGKECHVGLSSAWEPPQKVVEHMHGGLNMAEAAVKAGFSTNPELGAAEGLVGVVTKGRLNRKKYTMEALRTALIHLEP